VHALPIVRCAKPVPAIKRRTTVQTVLPLSWKEASAETVNAIAYATRHHTEWFWRGAQDIGKWRGNGALAIAVAAV
jgi:hypothetical protein